MKLHLPKRLLAALATAFLTSAAATLATGSAAYGVEEITTNTNKASSGTYSGFNVSNGATLGINNGSGSAGQRREGNTVTLGPTNIAGGSKLSLWCWAAGKFTYVTNDKVTIDGSITLNGTDTTAATLYMQDGSYNFSGDITVVNKGVIESNYAKGNIIQSLKGNSSADLTFRRNNNDTIPGLFYLAGANEYAGTVTLLNKTATADKPNAWNNLVIGHAEALKNAAVDLGTATTAAGNVRNALELNVASASIRALSGVGTVRLRSLSDGTSGVADITSATLTITGSDNGVFSGTIAKGVELVIGENASQTFSGVSLGSTITNNGALTLSGYLNVTDISGMEYDGVARPEGDGLFNGVYSLISGSGELTTTGFSGVNFMGTALSADAYSCTSNSLTATMPFYQIKTQKTSSELINQGAVVVTGDGTLVAGAPQSLGGLLLASDWTGTVQLSGAGTNMSFSKGTLANDFSTIELKGVSGWLTSNATSNANLILSDNGSTYALTVDNGTSGALHTFSGAITGSGTWAEVTNKGYRMTFKFTGDISAWKGQYVSNRSGAESYISFVNNVGGNMGLDVIKNLGSKDLTVGIQHESGVTMNGDFKREGEGALNLSVGTAYNSYSSTSVNSSDSATSATFGGKDVTLSKLNISTGSSATFQTTSPEALAEDNTKTSSVTIDQLTGAGNLVLKTATSEYLSSSFTVSSMQGYTGSVSIVKTENGGSFTETPELSTGGGTAVTMSSLSLTGGARAKISAVQNLTINSLSSTGTNKLDVSVGNYATMSAITTTDLSLGVVNLSGANSAALSIRRDNSTGSISIDELQVIGNGTVNIQESATSGKGWNTTVNIAKLTNGSSADSSVVTLTNAARAGTSFYNIDGGNFNGEIVVKGMATTTGYGVARRTAVQLNNAAAVEGTLITFNAGNDSNNKLGLGVNADVALAGIQHASGSSVSSVIYSGKMTASDTDFASQGTDVHTITLTGGGTYTTSAKLASLLNISMSGSGSQSFTGDMSAFNGSLSVSAGSLNITNNVAAASQINVSGGTLTFDGSVGATGSAAAPATVKGGKLEVKGTYYGSLTQQGGEAVIANLSGNGALKSSAGTATVSNATGFSGALEATGGSITVSSASSLSALKATNGSTLNAKGIADYSVTTDPSGVKTATGGLSVSELVIGTGSKVQAWGSGDTWSASAEATVLLEKGADGSPVTLTVGTAGQTGTSTLNANLVLDGATVTLNNALTMGSTLTLNNVTLSMSGLLGGHIAKDAEIILFRGVDSLTLGTSDASADAITTGNKVDASTVFTNLGTDNFLLIYTGGAAGSDGIVALVAQRAVPEPTTATLSLLALMGLAARRRRRKS